MSLSTLLNEIEINKVNYNFIRQHLNLKIVESENAYINIIIPVMGRIEFLPALHSSLVNAISNVNQRIIITVVEISDKAEHNEYCNDAAINYAWLNINLLTQVNSVFVNGFNNIKLFNKSLAMNIGAIISPHSEYLLFHDLDCLVQSDFFVKLLLNIETKQSKAIQCFQSRRVLNLNSVLTRQIIDSEIDINNLNINTEGVSEPEFSGAPGGSIMVKSKIFQDIGGYDPELFSGYSTEDAFFWDKLSAVCEIHICDNPKIDIFHMYHTPNHNNNPLFSRMHSYWESFSKLEHSDKIKFIKNKKKMTNGGF